MTKLLAAAAVLSLAALIQPASAGNDSHGQRHTFVRPMINKHVVFKPAVQPMYKPVFIKHVQHKPMYRPAAYSYSGYQPSHHEPKYRYFPVTTYGYDSAPKDCSLVLYKSDYGMVRKVWRCIEVKKVEVAPIKIIERLVEKKVIEKQVIEKRSIEKGPTETEEPTDASPPQK